MLWGLPNLRHLERGDFLADVVEHLEEEANMTNSKVIKRMPSLKVCVNVQLVIEFHSVSDEIQ